MKPVISFQLTRPVSRRGRAPVAGSGPHLDPEDLGQRGAADLELALVGLARPERALELEAGALERARDPGLRVALGPGEDLHRGGGRGEGDGAAGQRVRALEDAL